MRPIEKRLDKLASELCRLMAGGICKKCGREREGSGAHHIISCDHRRQRWNQENLVWLCWRPCHMAEHDYEPTITSDLDQRVYIWSLPELQELEQELKLKIETFNNGGL